MADENWNIYDRQITNGSHWRHFKGNAYRVLCCALRESDKEPMVVYRSVANPDELPWIRPKSEFLSIESVSENPTDITFKFTKIPETFRFCVLEYETVDRLLKVSADMGILLSEMPNTGKSRLVKLRFIFPEDVDRFHSLGFQTFPFESVDEFEKSMGEAVFATSTIDQIPKEVIDQLKVIDRLRAKTQ